MALFMRSALFASLVAANADARLQNLQAECTRPADSPPLRTPYDLNTTFDPIARGARFATYAPKVLSVDPWLVYFDEFMTDEEVYEYRTLIASLDFQLDAGGDAITNQAVRSCEVAYCSGECDNAPIVQRIRHRISTIANAPVDNFDFTQAVRFKEGMYYEKHIDSNEHVRFLPCGARVFTAFVYLAKAEEGGHTRFPWLGLDVEPKPGAAVFFANTRDEEPGRSDVRTSHEALMVQRGEKVGLNHWIHEYDFRDPWKRGCVSAANAAILASKAKLSSKPPQVPIELTIISESRLPVQVLWMDLKADVRNAAERERFLLAIEPGQTAQLSTEAGQIFRFRSESGLADADLPLLREYLVRPTPAEQVVNIGLGIDSGVEL